MPHSLPVVVNYAARTKYPSRYMNGESRRDSERVELPPDEAPAPGGVGATVAHRLERSIERLGDPSLRPPWVVHEVRKDLKRVRALLRLSGHVLHTRRIEKRCGAAARELSALRDAAAVRETGLPAWCGGSAAPASVAELHFVGWQEAIGCGGVAVMPGDMIVAEGDGAVAIPADLADEVARDGAEQEAFETWAQSEVEAGAALPGLYPPNDETRARFDAWRAAREAAGS